MADQTQIIGDIKPAPHTQKFRRIVTGHDENNTAIFLEDQLCPNRFATGGCETFVINELWKMDQTPGGEKMGCDNVAPYTDPATSFTLNPPACGNVFRIIEFPPDGELGMKEDGVTPEEPIMHRTPSVDYAVILKGECYAVMDGGETLMKEGDVLIQRGTIHAWSNRSDKPCLILFVLCGADAIPGLPHK